MRTATSGARLWVAAGAAVFLLSLASGARGEASQTSAEPAVWAPREIDFVYMGITAHYSCDGLRDRVRDVLLQLGARPDFEVRESPCVSVGRPDVFPGVRIRMNVLQPGTGEGAAAVPAHWKRIDLTLSAGECELLEQVRTQILPLFATRHVDYGSNCQPHQLQLGAGWLRAEVLVADPDPAGRLSTGSPGPAPRP